MTYTPGLELDTEPAVDDLPTDADLDQVDTDDDETTDVDPDQTGGDEGGDRDSDDDAGEDSAAARARAGGRTGANRALIRRVANKAAELADAPAKRRDLLARLLGVDPDSLSDLTFAVMTSDRSALAAVADLNTIAAADPFDAAVETLSLGRARMRAVWALLTTLGEDIPKQVPSADVKAAKTLARAVKDLSQDTSSELNAVVALARKS